MNGEQKHRIGELERHNKYLSRRVNEDEKQITEQNELLESFVEETEEEEVWADVIEDRWKIYLNSTTVAPEFPENSGAFWYDLTKSVAAKTSLTVFRCTTIPLP